MLGTEPSNKVKRSVAKRMDRILIYESDTSEEQDLAERACIAVVGTTPLRAPKQQRRSRREPHGEHGKPEGNVEADYESAPLLISDHFGLRLDYRPPAAAGAAG